MAGNRRPLVHPLYGGPWHATCPIASALSLPQPLILPQAHDLAEREPEVLAAIARNFSKWYDSIHDSIANESRCGHRPSPVEAFPPGPITASTACTFHEGVALGGGHMAEGSVASREECCGACVAVPGCGACEFVEASRMRPTFEGVATGGTCRLKRAFEPRPGGTGEGRTAAVTPTA